MDRTTRKNNARHEKNKMFPRQRNKEHMTYAVTYMPKIYGQKIKFKQKTLSMNNVNVNNQLARSLRTELHLHLSRVLVLENIRRRKTSLAEDLASQITTRVFQNFKLHKFKFSQRNSTVTRTLVQDIFRLHHA